MQTTHWTDAADAQMVFQFKGWPFITSRSSTSLTWFLGTKVAVFGTVESASSPGQQSVYLFSVDSEEPSVRWVASHPNETVYNQLMYSSTTLEDKMHTLTMQSVFNHTRSFIDYLEFAPSQSSSTSSQPPLSSSSSLMTSSSSSPAISASSTFSTNPPVPPPANSLNNQDSGKPLPVSIVVSVSVGATVVAMLILTCILLWRRRRRQQRWGPSASEHPVPTPESQITCECAGLSR